MNNYCNCKDDSCSIGDKSKNMYSIDYDSLIERLERTRDEIDETIRILSNKKMKDSVINDILSSDDDETITANEVEEMLRELDKKRNNSYTTNVKTPLYYKYRYPYKYYPYFWF